ncbi:117_t:CDS:2, partial [Scutellospora calospora]
IGEPDNFEDAIASIQKIEAGEYYDEKMEEEKGPSNQQIQVLYASFEKLTSTLAVYVESTTRPQTICEELRHISRNCMSERVPRDVNHISVLEEEEKPTRNDEAVVMPADYS